MFQFESGFHVFWAANTYNYNVYGTELSILSWLNFGWISPENSGFPSHSDGFPKQPAVNLTNLMVLALIEADSKGLSIVCKDAYKFVNKRFPFYDVKNPECSNSWKNSVRHTLNVVLADRKILTRRAPPKLETDCNCLGQCTHETGGKTIYSYGMYWELLTFNFIRIYDFLCFFWLKMRRFRKNILFDL